MGSRKQSYQGKIVTAVEKGTTSGGKLFVKFALQSGSELIDCVAWYSMLDPQAPIDSLQKGEHVIVRGFFGEANGKGEEFVIKWFEVLDKTAIAAPAAATLGYREQLGKMLGTENPAKIEKHILGVRSEMENRGFVLVRISGVKTWTNRKYALQYNNQWFDRAEFLMDHLGAETIANELRAAGITISDRRKNCERYNELLEKLIPQAIAAAERRSEITREQKAEQGQELWEEGAFSD